MIAQRAYSIQVSDLDDPAKLSRGLWIVILHASRVPPHVGLLVNGSYNSLTIKGRELDVSKEALLKIISQRRIESLFIRIVKHPVFSEDHQLNIFREQLMQFEAVKPGEATCLSPLKIFFEEFYAVPNQRDLLLADFLGVLSQNDFTEEALCTHAENTAKNNIFTFNPYSAEELQERIRQERTIYHKD